MGRVKLGAGVWDLLVCEDCNHSWTDNDLDLEWTDDPEPGGLGTQCPHCQSDRVTREERG